ncbi:uncharacterized protein LOC124491529 [Dermatophagoides farinae]|uniref:Uncharacterized protein n=1 Tax=Dermatophagoides farinae TaxID=6954 RepID=A0A922IG92_DERFA|nr:hypothetical protein DERF_003733 [Dermatophagoides farinae]
MALSKNNNNLSLWPQLIMMMATIVFVCLLSSPSTTVFARSYYPPKYEDNRQSRIKLNLGLHVPPIIVKLPRMEMPQLVIGANLIKNPKAKPLVLNMPPPPSISFGDSKYDGGAYGHAGYSGGYQYAASGSAQTENVKTSPSNNNEYGMDLKAYSSDQYQNMMHPSAGASVSVPPPPPPPVPVPMVSQYSHAPHYSHQHHHAMMPPPPPPPSPSMHFQHEHPDLEPKPMPPMMPPHMLPPPPPPMASPIQSYPIQQPPYYGTIEHLMPHYPVERMSLSSLKAEAEPGMMMAMSTNQQHHRILPPPPSAYKSPFQLLKSSGDDFKFRLKPNAEIFDSAQMYSAINDDQQDSDTINEDYSKDYNAAPKISMPKYQQRN